MNKPNVSAQSKNRVIGILFSDLLIRAIIFVFIRPINGIICQFIPPNLFHFVWIKIKKQSLILKKEWLI